jgi:hypothetical protein
MATAVTPVPAQTYASMLQTLRVRCKQHATIGNTPALNDILTEAHDFVYGKLDDGYPVQDTITLSANVATQPWVADVDAVPIARGSVRSVWIAQGTTERDELPQGITHAMRADAAVRAPPERYDSRFIDTVWSIEVWPTPDAAYTLYVDHNRVLTRFTEPTDAPSVNARLVLAYAIALGKAHYQLPDAETAGQAFKSMLSKEQYRQKEERRFIPPSLRDARPRVIAKVGGGFTQVWD